LERHYNTFARIAVPLKSLFQRFLYLGLVLVAFGLMLLGKFDAVMIDSVRLTLTDAFTPILEGLSHPAATVSKQITNIRDLANIRDENGRLKEENARLLKWQTVARKLQADNDALKQQLSVVNDKSVHYITARVIASSGGVLSNMMILNAGKQDGVVKGQTVIGRDGVIGRISAVSKRSSRVLLLTDINSRVPILIESNRIRAVMVGKNTERTGLIHLPQGAKITVGDRIITSGHGGAFPSGLPIGIIVSVSDNNIDVQPFTELSKLEYVRIADFGLNSLVNMGKDAASPETKLNGKFVKK